MISIGKLQTAGKKHECDECEGDIEEGQKYQRIAQFESWEDIGVVPEAAFSDTTDPYVQQQFWKKVARSKNVLILKVHNNERICDRNMAARDATG